VSNNVGYVLYFAKKLEVLGVSFNALVRHAIEGMNSHR
jgi:hypothetical protein